MSILGAAPLTHNRSDTIERPTFALTLLQFAFIAVEGFVHFFCSSTMTLKAPKVPRRRWLWPAVVHYVVSILNNLSLQYNISVPMHIVLRSGGGLITLCVGTLVGKRYSKTEWVTVVTMTFGVLLIALDGIQPLVVYPPILGCVHSLMTSICRQPTYW